MMRRPPEVILAAHELDLERRELYVEGAGDRSFFNWLTSGSRHRDAMVFCIDDVDMPSGNEEDAEGGNRGRLLRFLELADGESSRIFGFVDQDQDHLLSVAPAVGNVILSDYRDLESYVLFEDNIDQALRAGGGTERVSASDFLTSAFEAASFLASIRLVSTRQSLKLPVGGTVWEKKITVRGGLVTSIDREGVIRQLMQNSGIHLKQLPDLLRAVDETSEELSAVIPQLKVQGKDTMRIMRLQFRSLGIDVKETFHLLGSTFSKASIGSFPRLGSAVDFLADIG